MRTEPSRSTQGIQGFSSSGSAKHALSTPFAFRATIGQSASFRAKESSGFGSGTTTTTTAFSRATEDLANTLPFSGLCAAKPAQRFYADLSAAGLTAETPLWASHSQDPKNLSGTPNVLEPALQSRRGLDHSSA
jgi:hypothetical protein